MERWEYLTEFVWASIDNPGVSEFLQQNFAGWENPPKYIPQAMIPHLNNRGQEGWELVHMQPVSIGANHDIAVGGYGWSNAYFCAFKRRIA